MSKLVQNLPPFRDIAVQYPDWQTDDPTVLKSMIAALQAENAKIEVENAKLTVTLCARDQLVQALRLRIAKLQKLAFGKSSEKMELALKYRLVTVAEDDDGLKSAPEWAQTSPKASWSVGVGVP
jgi:hypothetical protein